MAMVVWVMMGIAVWHFTVFLPDRFYGGIVGAFAAAFLSAAIFGFLVNGLTIPGQSDTNISQALIAIPGSMIGLALSYWYGARMDRETASTTARREPARTSRPFRPARIPVSVGCSPSRLAGGATPMRSPLDGGLPLSWASRRSSARSSPAVVSGTSTRPGASSRPRSRTIRPRCRALRPRVELILRHVERGSQIAVFGDYDVDGVCSTAILVRTLRVLGADPVWELPSRFDEGYGLSGPAVERLAGRGVGLLVTVDCGITAVEQVAAARAAGLDVIVTDHHRPGDELPDCTVVHPALGDYGCPELCASGVVLKLSEALLAAAGRDASDAAEDVDLAALATVCDLVPLRGENRRIVREGLVALGRTRKPGLRALMEISGVAPGELSEQSLGFRLGPRINAAGRMQRADAALELLLTDDDARAGEVARELDLLNRDRQEAETRILFAAEAACAPQAHEGAIVVAGEGWHPGVVGIVASRLVERWRRPCVVIALDGQGGGRGSGAASRPTTFTPGWQPAPST